MAAAALGQPPWRGDRDQFRSPPLDRRGNLIVGTNRGKFGDAARLIEHRETSGITGTRTKIDPDGEWRFWYSQFQANQDKLTR
jgi:hypothetical protein